MSKYLTPLDDIQWLRRQLKDMREAIAELRRGKRTYQVIGVELEPAEGWGTTSLSGLISNGTGTVEVSTVRTGANITADSIGNITDTLITSVPEAFWPTRRQTLVGERDGYHVAIGRLNPDGQVQFTSTLPAVVISAGQNFTFSATYMLG